MFRRLEGLCIEPNRGRHHTSEWPTFICTNFTITKDIAWLLGHNIFFYVTATDKLKILDIKVVCVENAALTPIRLVVKI